MQRFFFPLLALATVLLILVLNSFSFENFEQRGSGHEKTPGKETVILMFGGDMMFDRYIRKQGEIHGYESLLAPLSDMLSSADAVIANLEGPITSSPTLQTDFSQSNPHHYTFTFDPTVTAILKSANIQAVSLGNNHILNFGPEGVRDTTRFLNEAGIAYFGLPEASQTTLLTLRGMNFRLVSFNEFGGDSVEETADLIRELSDTGEVVVVFVHWGEEYEHAPNDFQIHAAHTFVDAGADLVVGAHPHVIQAKEMYKNVPIYYSLGNFIFDQYFDESVRCGLLLEVSFTGEEISGVRENGLHLEKDGSTHPSSCVSSYL